MSLKGSKNLQKQLKKIDKEVKKQIDGTVTLDELLTEEFLNRYTEFTNMEDLLNSLPVKIESQEDLDNLDETKVNSIIRDKTNFGSFSELLQAAANYYAKKKIEKLF